MDYNDLAESLKECTVDVLEEIDLRKGRHINLQMDLAVQLLNLSRDAWFIERAKDIAEEDCESEG